MKESFLEDINNILNAGDVPNLFDDNEVQNIQTSMRPLCQAAGLPLNKVALYSHFIKRVRTNIHMSLCLSPMGEAFRTRMRNFPSLVNNCTIDFFAEWPEEALRSVAFSALDGFNLGDNSSDKVSSRGMRAQSCNARRDRDLVPRSRPGTPQVRDGVVTMCGHIHLSVEQCSKRYLEEQRRYNYVTPTSYLEVLSTFKTLLTAKRDEVTTAKRRLVIGLEKLETTEVEVDHLKKQLEEMQPVRCQSLSRLTPALISAEPG